MPIARIKIENLKEVQAALKRTAAEEIPFVTAAALTGTAKVGQGKIRGEILPAHFTLRHAAWMKNNIRVEPATKTKLLATIRDTFGSMVLQEGGGTKIPYGAAIAVPTKFARPSAQSLILPENRPAAVMARGGFIRGNVMYAVAYRRKGRLKRGAAGPMNAAPTDDGAIVPMYVLVPRATIRPRYGFEAALLAVVAQEFAPQFSAAFQKYVRTK